MKRISSAVRRSLNRLSFSLWYFSRPPWDTGQTPPELIRFVESGRPPGRALDLGCGTGTNVIYLARHGWQATGVDFVLRAIERARRKARAASVSVDLRVGDVTRLEDLTGPFDLILDIGCFHSLTPDGRERYAAGVARLSRSGTALLMYEFLPHDHMGLSKDEMVSIFCPPFQLTRFEEGTGRPSAWYTFERDA